MESRHEVCRFRVPVNSGSIPTIQRGAVKRWLTGRQRLILRHPNRDALRDMIEGAEDQADAQRGQQVAPE